MNSRRFFARQASGDRFGFGPDRLDPATLARLDRIIAATGAKIVICSAWRHGLSSSEIAEMMRRRGFQRSSAIIGETESTDHPHRGREISDWLAMERERRVVDPDHEPVIAYAIIDDNDEFDGEQRDHYIQPDPEVGLTDADARDVIRILKGDL